MFPRIRFLSLSLYLLHFCLLLPLAFILQLLTPAFLPLQLTLSYAQSFILWSLFIDQHYPSPFHQQEEVQGEAHGTWGLFATTATPAFPALVSSNITSLITLLVQIVLLRTSWQSGYGGYGCYTMTFTIGHSEHFQRFYGI